MSIDFAKILGIDTQTSTTTSAATSPVEEPFSYNTFLDSLHDAGLKTSRNNFEDRANALSDDFKAMIQNSFDCEQDYVLQQKIAGLYKNKSAITSDEFMRAAKSMGLQVSRTWAMSSSYIKENGTYVADGRIGVYTVSDGEGGEIVIVDANGNGFLETEEIFLNQILEGISSDIVSGQIVSPEFSYGSNSYVSSGASGSNQGSSYSSSSNHISMSNIEHKAKISQAEYNRLVDYYVSFKGLNVKTAIEHVNMKYDLVEGQIQYSGENLAALQEENSKAA
ncbi:hypothetical protein IJ531_00575 [bacterium]|nr:hypothetical protein [bacterium]